MYSQKYVCRATLLVLEMSSFFFYKFSMDISFPKTLNLLEIYFYIHRPWVITDFEFGNCSGIV